MKNTILVAGALLLASTSMISCKKSYTCRCSKTYTTSSGSTTQSNYAIYTYDDTRNRAEDRCNTNTSTGTDLGGDYSINCKID
jgi:hypothetical protein